MRPRACSMRGRGSRSATVTALCCASIAGHDPSGDPRDHPRRGAAYRGRHFRGALSARRSCAGCAIDAVLRYRRADAADRADRLYAAQVLADPIGLNSRLGTYTNFVNLLDLCGARRAGVDPRRRRAVRRHAARARRPRRAAGARSAASSTPTPNCRSARDRQAQPPLAQLARWPRRRNRRSRWSARISPAWRSMAS